MRFDSLPGGDLIESGLADLARGLRSAPALLVAIGAPRLRELGVDVPAHAHATPERALGREADREGRAYLVGGSTAVLMSWRQSMIEIDLKL